MAKLTIEIEENEYALYDVEAFLDGKIIYAADNHTSERAAIREVHECVRWDRENRN